MLRRLVVSISVLALLTPAGATAGALLVTHPADRHSLDSVQKSQRENLAHVRFVCRHGRGQNRVRNCAAVRWLSRELAETTAAIAARRARAEQGSVTYWMNRQIAAATWIGQHSAADPWPNCPDPFHGGGGWDATVRCENGGNWLDSPGYFRCGLQFEPAWERRFGRLCP